MQNLRDKLVRAGLASKEAAREARTERRRQRKQEGGARAEAELQRQQEQRYQAKQAERAEQSKSLQKTLEQERVLKESVNRLQNLIRAHALLRVAGTDRPFYFMGRDRLIRRLQTTFELAAQLRLGNLAIVEADHDPQRDYALIDAATARRIEELDAARILFWNKPGAAEDEDLPTYGAR